MTRSIKSLVFAIAALLAFAASARAQSVPNPTVTIDFSVSNGPATQRASGFLHGMDSTVPSAALVNPMKGKLWRGSTMYADDGSTYSRVVGIGGTPMLLLSDLWNNISGNQYGTGTHPCDDGSGCTAWRTFVANQVNSDRAAGKFYQYDIWNEPDLTQYWNRSAAQFDEAWQAAVQVIRGINNGIIIVGPSTCCNLPYAEARLNYDHANNVFPNFVAFHEFGGPVGVSSDVSSMRSYLAGVSPGTLIELPEMVDQGSSYLSGTNVQYLAAAERAQVDGAAHACWGSPVGHDCFTNGFSGNLDGLVKDDAVTPRAVWFAYQGYAAVTGTIVGVTPGSSGGATVDGVAGSNCSAQQAYSVFGMSGANSSPIFNFIHISVGAPCLIVGGKVHAKIFTLADDSGNGSTGPVSNFETELNYPISGDELSLSSPAIPNMGANDVIMIQLTPPSGGGGGSTYYIDYVNGNDTNNGTSKLTPWKHLPGMQGTVNGVGPGAFQDGSQNGPGVSPGQSFILKGGTTWPAPAFPMQMVYKGASTSTTTVGCAGSGCIYVGVDQTWYAGASWSRPIFDGGHTMPGAYPGGLPNSVTDFYGGYFTVDNIEFPNWYQVGNPSTVWSIIAIRCTHCEFKNNYLHAWGHSGTTGGVGGTFIDSGRLISGGPSCPADMTSSIHDNAIDGWDSSQDAFEAITPNQGYVYNNYISLVDSEILGSARYVFNNDFGPTAPTFFDASSHGNVLEATNCTLIAYNNFSTTGRGGATFFPSPITGAVDYDFNNVFVNQTNQTFQIDNAGIEATGGGGGSGIYVFNNTIQSPPGFALSPISAGQGGAGHGDTTVMPFVYVANNHLIGDNTTVNLGMYIGTPTNLNQVPMTNAQATAAGYISTSTFPYTPPTGTSATVGKGLSGTTMEAICAGIPSDSLAQASTACMSDSTVGVGYNSTTHTTFTPNRTPILRPTTTAWSVGAYEPSGVIPPPVITPRVRVTGSN